MAIKLLVTDLDGTVLPQSQVISSGNIQAVQKAAAAGVTVTVATGRMYQAALPPARMLGVDAPIISYNGAIIRTIQGETLYENFLPPEIVQEVIDFCKAQDLYVQNYSGDCLHIPERNEMARSYEDTQRVTAELVGWDRMRNLTEAVPKLLCITKPGEEASGYLRMLSEYFGERVQFVQSAVNYIEVINPGVSKAAAIGILARKMGIRQEEVMAIGDSGNDIPMLKAAGVSVAMGNALPEVKAVCDHVTTDCEEDGFAEAVYRYVLA